MVNVPMQEASRQIWEAKYCLKDARGEAVDASPEDAYRRVARALAEVEGAEAADYWEEQFVWALEQGAVPAGRILSNAGASHYKPATSLINCTVSRTIDDSMRGILEANLDAGITLKSGAGIGYDFSTLRPKGAPVAGAGSETSGPLSFMDVFDKMCSTISSAGGRRGAQMATFDVGHPDIADFVRAKREDGRLRQFNLSVLITDAFIEAVKADDDWQLAFPLLPAEREDVPEEAVVYREWPVTEGYVTDDEGRVAMRVYDTVKARRLWNLIMGATYEYAEPGIILIDEVNRMNNLWFAETIRATNPCGEQPLPPGGSCLLGSVNLTRFVRNPFAVGGEASFDWETYREVVRIFTRMLDNVVELNGLPLESQRAELERKRRHGMGYLGLGSALAMLGIPYGSAESLAFTEEVTREMALTGWQVGLDLAREKGPAPVLAELFEVTPGMLARRPEMAADGYRVGDRVPGRVLHARYSRYMQRLAEQEPDLVAALEEEGARFTHHTSIAPTGTIALSLGNNASNGVEPTFGHRYFRNVIRPGRKTKEQVEVCSFELLCYRHHVDPDATESDLPESCTTAETVTPGGHIAIQAAAQCWVDSSISKTVNVATDYPYDAFKDIYLDAHESGLKGCTTFRFNPEVHQGVLVRESDLSSTRYRFETESGTVVEALGSEELEYEGEVHSAANLYDALKEGWFGRY